MRRRSTIAGLLLAVASLVTVSQVYPDPEPSPRPLLVSSTAGSTVLTAMPDGNGCWTSNPYTICETLTDPKDLFISPGAITAPHIPGTPCWSYDSYVIRSETVPFEACTAVPSTTTTEPPTPTTTTEPPPAPVTTPPPATTVPSGVQFVEPFDTPASLDRFDFAVHHAWTFGATKNTWAADHDLSCSPPTLRRTVTNPTRSDDGKTYYRGMIEPTSYWCREHLMTTFNTNHYAQVDFAPKQTFTNVDRVCWAQNRTAMGSRHWTQLVIVPASTFSANNNRLDYVASRFSPSGPGKYGIHPTDATLLVEFGKGVPRVQVGQQVFDSQGLAWNAGSDRSTRYQHCVIDTGAGLRIEISKAGGTEVFTRNGSIPDGPVKVIFQQDLYNPDKANDATGEYTVHWDGIFIE